VASVVPLMLLQWTPAFATFVSNGGDPSTHAAYFRPLLGFLETHARPPGRVEVVPTKLHWEAAYVAPFAPLARGWERQLDTADNPLFYDDGTLGAATYRAWLLDNGVRYVALPDVPLDYAAVSEGRLLARGVPGLRLAWHDAHWRVFEVTGAPGIVQGPGRLVSLDSNEIVLDATAPGTITVRVRYSPRWALVQGQACVHEDSGGWTAIDTNQRARIGLQLQLVSRPAGSC
jgi:hypothetical protein